MTFGDSDTRRLVDDFLSVLGTSIEVADEQMNLYTALTAVGPTDFLPIFDAIIQIGVEYGLSREEAVTAAVETARGTAAMVAERAESAEALRLYTGLRPLEHDEVRTLVKTAAVDAFDRMPAVQNQLSGN